MNTLCHAQVSSTGRLRWGQAPGRPRWAPPVRSSTPCTACPGALACLHARRVRALCGLVVWGLCCRACMGMVQKNLAAWPACLLPASPLQAPTSSPHACTSPQTSVSACSGAYYKYSSGGTPVLLWALGSGFEGQDDLDEVYRFRWVAGSTGGTECVPFCLDAAHCIMNEACRSDV